MTVPVEPVYGDPIKDLPVTNEDMPRGIRNNNPGNIDKSLSFTWQGQIRGDDPRFATFSSMAFGVRALGDILLNYHNEHGLTNIREYISRWAPSVENSTEAYIRDVCRRVGVKSDAPYPITEESLPPLIKAIVAHENGGGSWITDADMALAMKMLFHPSEETA